MFGGNFGHESEQRDANKRPSGRRHQPRDMAEVNNILPSQLSANANVVANEARRAQQRENMSNGPSFLDQMGGGGGAPARPGHRRVSGPQNQLTSFGWDNNDSQQPEPHRGKGQQRSGACAAPVQDPSQSAEAIRQREVNKFSSSANGHFLQFSENAKPKGLPAQPRGAVAGATAAPAEAPYGSPQHGMMDALMRDDSTRAGAPPHSSKRCVKQQQCPDGPEVAGFPGMGQRSAHKPFQRINRKVVPSSVFPPGVQGVQPPAVSGDDDEEKNFRAQYPGQQNQQHYAQQQQQPEPEWLREQLQQHNVAPQDHSYETESEEAERLHYMAAVAAEARAKGKHVGFDDDEYDGYRPDPRAILYQQRHQA